MWHPSQRPLLRGGRQPRPTGPPLTFPLSLLSSLSLSSSSDLYPAWRALCFIWPAGPLPSSVATTPSVPPQLWHQLTTEIQFHHTKSYHQHVLRETAASNWPCFSSWRLRVFSSPGCCQTCNTVLQFVLSSKRETEVHYEMAVRLNCMVLESKLTVHYIFWKSYTKPQKSYSFQSSGWQL